MSSNTKSFTFPIVEVRSVKDPVDEHIKTHYALMKVKDLPLGIPTDPNPRTQNLKSKIAKEIYKGLVEEEELMRFHLLNRGITISAYTVNFNSDKKLLSVVFKDRDESYGIVDGGHTYEVIMKNRHELDKDQFVRLEIITGIENDIVAIARARNTSMQVQEKSLADLEGKFDWIKEIVEKNFKNGDRIIAYKENEEGLVDIRDVIGILTAFNPHTFKKDQQPIEAYSSKQRCIELYKNNLSSYQKLRGILPDVLKLYDYIQWKAPQIWNEGKLVTDEENEIEDAKAGRYGSIRGVKKLKRTEKELCFISKPTRYITPEGWLYPMLAAFRTLLNNSNNGSLSWRTDPFEFFDKHGRKLLEITKEVNDRLGGNPNAVGKYPNHWEQLFDKVTVLYSRN